MARIPYFDPADAAGPRAKKAYEKLPHMNVFRMMGHSGELIDGFTKLGTQILNFAKLDPVLREIAIIRVGILSNAAYEVKEHERIGRRIGMSDALIGAVHEGAQATAFDPLQQAVMRFTDDVVLNVRASDETFEPLRAALSLQELQELVMTIGYYMALARFLVTFDVDLEEKPVKVTVDAGRG